MDTQYAEKVESLLNEKYGEDGFALPTAELYGVNIADDQTDLVLIGAHADVYEMLENSPRGVGFAYVAIVTTGWAAPLDENGEVEGRPSHHPERRRVRLCVVANRDVVTSVLRFQDDPDNTVTDPGQATGSLADAIADFLA